MMRAHVPGATVSVRLSPAGIWSATGRVTGASAAAAATSDACTAYPSIDELSNGGSEHAAFGCLQGQPGGRQRADRGEYLSEVCLDRIHARCHAKSSRYLRNQGMN